MEACHLKHQVDNGSILRFHIHKNKQGRTLVIYSIVVYATIPDKSEEQEVFSTSVSFVHLSPKGRPCELPQKNNIP